MTLIVLASKLEYNDSPSSRAKYIADALCKFGMPTKVIGMVSSKSDRILGNNVVEIKQISDSLIGKVIVRLVIITVTLHESLSQKNEYVILRGYDLMPLAFFVKVLGKKIIYDFHGYVYKEQVTRGWKIRPVFTMIMERLMFFFTDYIIVVSEGTRRQLGRKLRSKTILLQNGIDINLLKNNIFDKRESIKNCKNGLKKIIGFIGSISPWFDFDDIIKIEDNLKERIQVLIIGDGPSYQSLRVKSSNSEHITLLGRLPHEEVISLLKDFYICIVPYNKNWFGSDETNFFSSRKIIEYLAAGKPIIIPNVKGAPTFLKNYENVLFYTAGDPHDLSEKIDLLLNDSNLYSRISENNQILSNEFTWDKLVEKSGLLSIVDVNK